MITRYLASTGALILLSTSTAVGEIVDKSPRELEQAATHVLTGEVKRVYRSQESTENHVTTHFVAAVLLASVEKGGGLKTHEVAFVRYWTKRWIGTGTPPPGTSGYRGLPEVGDSVRVFARRATDGALDVVIPNGFVPAGSSSFEEVGKAFVAAFRKGDAQVMATFCADHVEVLRDPRLSSKQEVSGHTGEELGAAYQEFFDMVGRDRWNQLVERLGPRITVAETADSPCRGVRPGDRVLDMHFREATKGERRGLDEAVLFVFRETPKGLKIVLTYADY